MASQGVWYGDYGLWEQDMQTVRWMIGMLATL